MLIEQMNYTELSRLYKALLEIGTPQCKRVASMVMAQINDVTLFYTK